MRESGLAGVSPAAKARLTPRRSLATTGAPPPALRRLSAPAPGDGRRRTRRAPSGAGICPVVADRPDARPRAFRPESFPSACASGLCATVLTRCRRASRSAGGRGSFVAASVAGGGGHASGATSERRGAGLDPPDPRRPLREWEPRQLGDVVGAVGLPRGGRWPRGSEDWGVPGHLLGPKAGDGRDLAVPVREHNLFAAASLTRGRGV